MFTQDVLRAELAHRVRAAAAGLGGTPAPVTGPVDLTELAEAQASAPDVAAIAVLRGFEPAAFARSALEFAFGVGADCRDLWFRGFTRTLFLAGNPANLAERFRFAQVAEDGSVAWCGPMSAGESTGLRRLLKLFDGTADLSAAGDVPVRVPGGSGAPGDSGTRHELYLATAGVGMSDYLVHLNHTLAEAVLTGVLRPGDRLRLRHVPRLGSAVAPYRVLRVQRDTEDPERLRAYACLSSPKPDQTQLDQTQQAESE